MDFTDFNMACPKDSFQLPKIDQVVDLTVENELYSLCYAFSRYNQIRMHHDDQDHLHYELRLILLQSDAFRALELWSHLLEVGEQDVCRINREDQVYVDDMLVKSIKVAEHLTDLDEIFRILKRQKMMLNATKCAFRVSLGKFLGFMVN